MPLNFIIQWTVLTFFLCFFLGLAYVFGGPYLLVFIFYKSSNRDCVGDFLNSAFSRGAEVLFSFLKSDSKIFILSGLWTLPVKFFVRLVFDFILLSFFEFQIMKTAILKCFFVVVLCLDASYASRQALANWSPQEVGRPLQEMPLSLFSTSSIVMPSTSFGIACRFPSQPP